MGLIRGSASFIRFTVAGKPATNYREDFPGLIARHGFRELDEYSDVERSAGWVNIMDMLDPHFKGEEFFKEGYIAMSLRVDVRKIPANVLRQHCLAAEREAKERDSVPVLPKGRRQEIREQVRWKLLKRAIPRSAIYDMVWDLSGGIVTFASLSSSICELFVEIFVKTFHLDLLPLFPYQLAAVRAGEIGLDTSRLDGLRPSSFVL